MALLHDADEWTTQPDLRHFQMETMSIQQYRCLDNTGDTSTAYERSMNMNGTFRNNVVL